MVEDSSEQKKSSESAVSDPPLVQLRIAAGTESTDQTIEDVFVRNSLTAQQIFVELVRLRARQEVSSETMPFDFIDELLSRGSPIQREDLRNASGERAVELVKQEVDHLGCFAFINAQGCLEVIDADCINDSLVLLPQHFGNVEQNQAMELLAEYFEFGLGTGTPQMRLYEPRQRDVAG
ncbi:hypothetical protein A3C37_01525 [Candidatus Peribacteria bacterium RIFCSPHIGHO2_02_FULL_53_20]|nr:MAG: hypothetical protein A3C37_01525 [Candidatus Peribacteria bacterium RIFCSPHIGHO2_02_FULL_53_20]